MTYRQSAARTSLAAPDAVTGKPLETGATRIDSGVGSATLNSLYISLLSSVGDPESSRVDKGWGILSVNKPAVVAGQSATMTIERKDVRGNW